MMRQIVFILMILVLFSFVNAQDNDPALNLDDILILGKAEALSDSIKPNQDNLGYTSYKISKDMNYIPEPLNFDLKEYSDPYKYQKNYLHLSAGNNAWILAKLNYYYKTFNINSRFFNYSTGNDYLLQEFDFSLKPVYKSYYGYLNFAYLQGKNKFIENNSRQFQVIAPKLIFDNSKYLPASAYIDLSINTYKVQADTLSEIDNHEQTEFNLCSNLNWKFDSFNSDINLNYEADKFSFSLSSQFKEKLINQLDVFSFWIAADEKRLVPSIKYSTKFNLLKNILVIFENNPQIFHSARFELLKKAPFIIDDFDFLAEKRPLNHNLIIQRTDIPVNFYWNCQYSFDKPLLYDISTSNAESSLHKTMIEDIWKNTLGIIFEQKWQSYTFLNETKVMSYSEDTYHLPAFVNSAKILWERPSFKSDFEFKYSTGSQDIENNYFEDMIMFNCGFRYNYGKYLDILFAVDNILDKDYRLNLLSYMAGNSGITLRGGLNLHF